MTNRPGYKHTSLGWLPEEWEIKRLGEIGKVVSGLTYVPSQINNEGVLVLRSSNIKNRRLDFTDSVYVKVQEDEYNAVQEGDILICVRNGSRNLIGKSALISDKARGLAFGAFMAVFRSDCNPFLYHVFDTDTYLKEIHKNLGATINSINGSDLKMFKVPFPPENERNKINIILSIWDKAITAIQQLVNQLQQRNKCLMQELLTGKKRIEGFKSDWRTVSLNECLKYTERVITKPETAFFALGIRSHGKGIFHKNDFDPEDLAMDVLYEVKEDDLIVNITFAWEQAIAIAGKQDDGGLVSHRFPTYTFKSKTADVDFFRYFILQKRFKYLLDLISPGGAGRNRVMSRKDFLKLEVTIPDVQEQKAIGTVLNSANAELNIYEQKLTLLLQQKRGVMQKLLTGEVRVKL